MQRSRLVLYTRLILDIVLFELSMDDTSQELDQRIEEALSCPCVDDIRDGPCGKQFKEAFRCYVKNFQSDEVSLIFCLSLIDPLTATQCTALLPDLLRAQIINLSSALSSLRSCSEGLR